MLRPLWPGRGFDGPRRHRPRGGEERELISLEFGSDRDIVGIQFGRTLIVGCMENSHIADLVCEWAPGRSLDPDVIRGKPRSAPPPVTALEQNRHAPPDKGRMKCVPLPPSEHSKRLTPHGSHPWFDPPLELRRRRSGPFGEREHMKVGNRYLREKGRRLLEQLFRLTRKADDHVGSDPRIRI